MRPIFGVASVLFVLALIQPSQALRIEMIGNSLTDQVNYDGFQQLAQARSQQHVWNRQMIPGAPIQWLYQHPKDGFSNLPYGGPYFALPNFQWDVLTLQPTNSMGSDTVYTDSFVIWAHDQSPFMQLYMYAQNPYRTDLASGASLNAAGFESTMNKTVTGELSAHAAPKLYWETIPLKLRTLNRHIKPVLMIPVGQVMQEFNSRAAAGRIPGYASAWDLYADDAHMTSVGGYLVGCTFYATIYKDDPRGLPVPAGYGTIPDTVAHEIQQCVFAVASTHPLSGWNPVSLQIIAHDTLPPACAHVPYFTAFGATQAGVTFSVTSGSLPSGLGLDGATGVISGKPAATGSFPITLTATKGSTTATVTRTITVTAAPAPQILTVGLDSVIVNCSYLAPLSGRYGYDTLLWSVSGGALPSGLGIGAATGTIRGVPASGVIQGIPTQRGTFSVTVQAIDGQSRSVTRQLSLKVVSRPVNGLDYEFYKSDTLHSVNSYRNLQPAKRGITPDGISSSFRENEQGYAQRLHGWLRVTKAGVHTFRAGSDYVSVITIAGRTIASGGSDARVYHEATDTITLQPGYYRFEHLWYNRESGWLNPGWQQPGDASVNSIPAASFYCDSAGVTGTAERIRPATPIIGKSIVKTYTLTGRSTLQTRSAGAGIRIVVQTMAGVCRVRAMIIR